MSWFSNLSIRLKILSITLLTLFGFLLYLGITYYANREIVTHLQDIQHHGMPALQRINAHTVDLVNLRESYAAAISERDELVLSQAESAAAAIEKNLAAGLTDSPETQAAQTRLLASFKTYNSYADSLARDMVSGRLEPAQAQDRLRELTRLQQEFDAQLQATKDAVYRGFADRIQQVQVRNDEVWHFGLAMGTLIAVAALALSLLITRRFVLGPLNHAVEAANKIAAGDWGISIVNAARDELGHMLQSIQKMRDRLKARYDEDRRAERIKTTVAELGNRMRGDLTLEQLAENILSYLVPALHGQVGLFYMPEGEELVLTASYAFTWRKSMSNRLKLGEGLVGQAAREKKQIVLTRVPDDYIVVSSGLGEAPPRHVIVTPILHEGELRGLLEVGSLAELGEEELEILQRSVEHIAVAVTSALSRRQLSQMLEQTQQQAELLRKQQEEMAAINADLEEQAIALSASEMRLQEQQEELKRANEELEEQTQALRASEESLQAQQEELRVINEELEAQARLLADQRNELLEKNEALKASQLVLEEKTRQLELSSKYKSEFLSTMSHELRTPLNSILILSNALADNKHGNLTEKQVEHARVIHSAGSDLLALINDILDIAKVEEGKMQLVIDTLDVHDLAEHFRRSFEHVAQHRGLQLHVNVDPATPSTMYTDRQRLEQVLRNFFSNALKFTHQGSVTLDIAPAPADLRFKRIKPGSGPVIAFAVKDTGIGVPKDKQEIIFEAFQQADGTTSRKYGGTGLGLTISREFSHLLGGEVHLHSEGEGMGSTFTLYLPVGAPDASTVSPEALPVDVPVTPPPAPTRAAGEGGHKSLIIIEDDENFAEVLAELANDYGFHSVVAHDGERGIEMVRQAQPDAVILDIGLPGIDGWQVLETLKNDALTRHIPVHCFSGRDESAKALHLGALAYYKKPATLEQIKEAFGRIEEQTQQGVRRLLVVEDNSVQHSAIHALFEENQVDVTVCTTGQEALEALRREAFDCMILDLSLPDMDGYALLETIHEDTSYPKLPIIVYTARDLTREQETRLRKYADRIILKTEQSADRLLSEASLFLHWVDSKEPHKGKPVESANHRDDVFNGKKVLLVDDDMRNIYALSASLEEWGCEIQIANNGQESLDALAANPEVDIVLMDIMMPEMDGYEAMRRIRAQERFKKLPILALTAKAMRDDRAKCIEAGANDYITKPVDIEKLQSLMRVWLHRT